MSEKLNDSESQLPDYLAPSGAEAPGEPAATSENTGENTVENTAAATADNAGESPSAGDSAATVSADTTADDSADDGWGADFKAAFAPVHPDTAAAPSSQTEPEPAWSVPGEATYAADMAAPATPEVAAESLPTSADSGTESSTTESNAAESAATESAASPSEGAEDATPTTPAAFGWSEEGADAAMAAAVAGGAGATVAMVSNAAQTQAKNAAENAEMPLSDLETTVVRRHSLLGPKQNLDEVAANEQTSPQWQPREAKSLGNDDAHLSEDALMAGASIKPAPLSRAGAHWWALLAALILVPLAWAFLNHAGDLLSAQFAGDIKGFNRYYIEGLGYFILGCLLVVIIGLATRKSALGMLVVGPLVTVLGLPFVVAPLPTHQIIDPALAWLDASNLTPLQLLGEFITSNGGSGAFTVYGLVLTMVGVVAHSARRQGRADRISNDALERARAKETE